MRAFDTTLPGARAGKWRNMCENGIPVGQPLTWILDVGGGAKEILRLTRLRAAAERDIVVRATVRVR